MRRLHFLGTLPQFADPRSALAWEAAEVRGELRRWNGGETGGRLKWFVPVIQALKASPKIRALRHGEWTGYDDVDRLAVRRGERLVAADIPLRLVEHFEEEWALLPETDRPLQVGVPGYLDMALFVFGPTGVPRYARVFREALTAQIAAIYARAGRGVVFQVEVPMALIAVAAAPPPLRGLVADVMARLVTSQVAAAPEGGRFGVHLCLGDLGHRALRQLRSADPLVRLTNAVVRHWPSGRSLDFVHLPMYGGDRVPSTDPAFYAPLRGLRPGIQLVAGIAHEDQSLADQVTVRRLVEDAVGGQVDIATACG
ncbi:MAG TPA: hypothetical protein VNO31_37505, partial [Umezawaea sp.]|nr:hypothetical protein [Umezawaea sp.]